MCIERPSASINTTRHREERGSRVKERERERVEEEHREVGDESGVMEEGNGTTEMESDKGSVMSQDPSKLTHNSLQMSDGDPGWAWPTGGVGGALTSNIKRIESNSSLCDL